MTAYRYLDPTSLFSVLTGIEALVTAEDWGSASGDARNVEDEARLQKSTDSKKALLWREFIGHAECLQITIRAQDKAGCVGELAVLHSALSLIAIH